MKTKTRNKKALVETLIKTASTDIPVNYKLYQKDGEWLVYDVVIEGVSLVSNYRSSYQAIVKKEGLDGLMLMMEKKLKELLAKIFSVDASAITDNTTPDTLENWDSLRHMNLVVSIEEEFGVELSDDQVVEILSYQLIKIVLQEHGVEFI